MGGAAVPLFLSGEFLMTKSWLSRLLKKSPRPASRARAPRPPRGRFLPALEPLDELVLLAVSASFSPSAGILTVFGDAQNNAIALSRDAAGRIRVNGGAVAVQGGTPTVANTSLIQAFGQDGNDS